jgi:hypothetical protein
MKLEHMDADMMEMMVNDWLADNADEMEGLNLIGKPYYSAYLDCWCQDAEDDEHIYILTAEADGNIRINYSGEG